MIGRLKDAFRDLHELQSFAPLNIDTAALEAAIDEAADAGVSSVEVELASLKRIQAVDVQAMRAIAAQALLEAAEPRPMVEGGVESSLLRINAAQLDQALRIAKDSNVDVSAMEAASGKLKEVSTAQRRHTVDIALLLGKFKKKESTVQAMEVRAMGGVRPTVSTSIVVQ